MTLSGESGYEPLCAQNSQSPNPPNLIQSPSKRAMSTMKTMGLIDQYGYTMEHMGRAATLAAEYRERSEWIEAHKAQEATERYRVQANRLRQRIKEAFFSNVADPAETDISPETAKVLNFKVQSKAA